MRNKICPYIAKYFHESPSTENTERKEAYYIKYYPYHMNKYID